MTERLASDLDIMRRYLNHLWDKHKHQGDCLHYIENAQDNIYSLMHHLGTSQDNSHKQPAYSKVTKALNRIYCNKTIKASHKTSDLVYKLKSNMRRLKNKISETERKNEMNAKMDICRVLLTLHTAMVRESLECTDNFIVFTPWLLELNTLYKKLMGDVIIELKDNPNFKKPLKEQAEELVEMLRSYNPELIGNLAEMMDTLN